ncbi:MAG TPA: peptide chain release factor N(5)-glutamine methyltransferase, partial [Gemmatimonadaceae bacterium]
TSVNAHVVVTAAELESARAAARRLAAGAPFAYAVGTAAFRKLTLAVDERVLIPRPETELIVDIVLELTKGRQGGTAIDVGTGSGAIALSLAAEGSFDRVLGGDLSSDAIAVARANADQLPASSRTRVEFREGSLLAPFAGEQADVIVSNPPYLAADDVADLPALVRDWEPAIALLSGSDGMAAIRRIIRDAQPVLKPGAWLVMEVDARRASWVVEALSMYDSYVEIGVRLDLTGRERFVVARRKGEKG